MVTFLGTTEKCSVLLETEINVNEVCASEELHYHSRSDNWRNSELHERAAIRGDDDAQPVQRVRRVGGHDSIERNLGAHQEDQKRHGRP